MHRLFIALRPPALIRAQLIAVMGDVAGARWQGDDHLHLTLRYVGEVDGNVAEDIAMALKSVRQEPVAVALNGVGIFDRKGRIDTLWAGVTPHERLDVLHKKIDQALVRIGLPPEGRAYLPHITLARFGKQGGAPDNFLANHAALHSDAFDMNWFALFESHLGRDGARYETIERYPLA
jgi:RNA 2',3'-cyclic 3'-phosphodiesterase